MLIPVDTRQVLATSPSLDHTFKSLPPETKAEPASLIQASIVSLKNLSHLSDCEADETDPTSCAKLALVPLIRTPTNIRITLLFFKIIPQNVRRRWSLDDSLFPALSQNLIVPGHNHHAGSREYFELHPLLQRDPKARQSLAELISDSKSPLWSSLIGEIENLVTEICILTHQTPKEPPAPDLTGLPEKDATEALALYQRQRGVFMRESGQLYKRHLSIRVRLGLLLAIAYHGRGLEAKPGETRQNIGATLPFYQALHHAFSPTVTSDDFPTHLQEAAQSLNVSALEEELLRAPLFEETTSQATAFHSIERTQIYLTCCLVASGIKLDTLIRAQDEDLTTPVAPGSPTRVSSLILSEPRDLFVERSLHYFLQNTTYLAKSNLNWLDTEVEKKLRDDLSGPKFREVCRGGSLGNYQAFLVSTISQTVIAKSTEVIALKDSYQEALEKYNQVHTKILEILSALRKAQEIAYQEERDSPEWDDRPTQKFPKGADLATAVKKLQASCRDHCTSLTSLNETLTASYYNPKARQRISNAAACAASGFGTSKLWGEGKDILNAIEEAILRFANEKDLRTLPSNFLRPERYPSYTYPALTPETSLLAEVRKIIFDLESTIEFLATLEEASTDIENYLHADATRISLAYSSLTSTQQLFLQQYLCARVLPEYKRKIDPASVPLEEASAAPVLSPDLLTSFELPVSEALSNGAARLTPVSLSLSPSNLRVKPGCAVDTAATDGLDAVFTS